MTLGLFTFIAETEEQAQAALTQLQNQDQIVDIVADQIYHDVFGNYQYKQAGSWVLEVVVATDLDTDIDAAKFVKWQLVTFTLQPPTAKNRFNEAVFTHSYN